MDVSLLRDVMFTKKFANRALSAVCLIIMAVPLIIDAEFDYGNYEKGELPLAKGILSDQFRYSVVAAIAVGIPIGIEYLADIVTKSRGKNGVRVSTETVFLLLIPNIIFRDMAFRASPSRFVRYLPYIIEGVRMLLTHEVLYDLHDICPLVWSWQSCSVMALSISLSAIYNVWYVFSPWSANHQGHLIISSICLLIYFGVYVYKLCLWVHITVRNRERDFDVLHLAYILTMLVLVVLGAYFGYYGFETSVDLLAWTNYVYIIVCMFICACNSALQRRKMELTLVIIYLQHTSYII